MASEVVRTGQKGPIDGTYGGWEESRRRRELDGMGGSVEETNKMDRDREEIGSDTSDASDDECWCRMK